MKFARLYHLGNCSVIEIFPDEYVKLQPVTFNDVPKFMKLFKSVETRIQRKCVVVIDCDKTVYFDKINFVILLEMIQVVKFPLIVIMKNCNDSLKKVIESIGSSVPKNIRVYFNDLHRI
jgi:hypothetical protein